MSAPTAPLPPTAAASSASSSDPSPTPPSLRSSSLIRPVVLALAAVVVGVELLALTGVPFPGGSVRSLLSRAPPFFSPWPSSSSSSSDDDGQAHLPPPPAFHIVCRAYAGDAARIFGILLPTIEAFFDFRQTRTFRFVFDNESPADHEVGTRVQQWADARGFPITVGYADPPRQAVLLASPYKSEGGRIAGPGYTRQLFDTFFFDEFPTVPRTEKNGSSSSPSSSSSSPPPEPERRLNYSDPLGSRDPAILDTDIIGILDADSPFVAPAVLSAYLQPPRGATTAEDWSPWLIRLCGLSKNAGWPGDTTLLGEPSNFNFMGAGMMPQLFFASTFKNARDHIAERWAMPTFEGAWLDAYGQPPGIKEQDRELHLSPANVLANYALLYEGDRYRGTVPGDDGSGVPLPVFSRNKALGENAIAGCCRTFALPACSQEEVGNWMHVTPVGPWREDQRREAATAAYAQIRTFLEGTSPERLASMRKACESVWTFTRGWQDLLFRR
jgi:hypothetical protein